MPFSSTAQRAWMFSHHPEMARRWQAHTPTSTKLLCHAAKKATVLDSLADGPAKEAEGHGHSRPPLYETPRRGQDALRSTDHYRRGVELSAVLHTKSSEEETAAQGEAQGPPNYRPSGVTGDRCAACAHYERGAPAQGHCKRYGADVAATAVCDGYQQLDVGLDRVLSEHPPAAPPMGGELSSPLTPGQAFKFGFLYRCTEEGLTADEMCARAEHCLERCHALTKRAASTTIPGAVLGGAKALWSGAAVPLAHTLANAGLLALIGVPIAAGAVGGTALAKMHRGDADPEAVKAQEMTDEYNRLAEEAERKRLLRDESARGTLTRVA